MWLFRTFALSVIGCFTIALVAGCFSVETPKKRLPRRIVIPVRPIRPNLPPPHRPKPCPGPWCPRSLLNSPLNALVGGRVSPDGVAIECDYPSDRMEKNLAGTDGSGLCVFASASRAMDWHGIRSGHGMLHWMTSKPGGGWPQKFDDMMREYFQEKEEQVPAYVQMDGTDFDFVQKALASGKLVCCTYNYSPSGRYSGGRISHMVNVHHHDGQRVAIGDNNFIGADQYEWLTVEEWKKCAADSRGRTWAIAFDAPAPPPPPHN